MHLQAHAERADSTGAGQRACPGSSLAWPSPVDGPLSIPAGEEDRRPRQLVASGTSASTGASVPGVERCCTTRFDSRFVSPGFRWSGRAVWVFRHSTVAVGDDDPSSLVTLLTCDQSLVPLGVSLRLDSMPLEPGQRISVASGSLEAGVLGTFRLEGPGVSLAPSAAKVSLDGLREHLDALDSLLERTPRKAPGGPRLTHLTIDDAVSARISAGLESLAGALAGEAGDAAEIHHAARSLSGLGPGLTPSGDDILVGLLAEASVLVEAGLLTNESEALLRSAVCTAPPTTPVAMAMRRHALDREFPEALARFVEALGTPLVSHSQLLSLSDRLVKLGARSGADLLSGVLALARAVVSKGQVR